MPTGVSPVAAIAAMALEPPVALRVSWVCAEEEPPLMKRGAMGTPALLALRLMACAWRL